jgi:hypothetical protein
MLWKRASFSIGAPLRGHGRDATLPRTLRERWDISSSGSLYNFGIREICKKRRPWKWTALSIGVPLGNLQEGSFTGDFERQKRSAR